MPVRASIIPPYLRKGDAVGLVCPAGHMPMERIRTCIRVLREEWGFTVREGATLGAGGDYFSGTDEERLADLQDMLDDPSVRAVLCARGGYGTGRIIDRLDFRRFRRNPKWLVGFSDITVLHAHVRARHRIATIHGPMAGAFNDGGWQGPWVGSLRKALTGRRMRYGNAPHPLDIPGVAEGVLLGGNLALLAHLVGTPSDPDTRGAILFIEDVGEQLYNIDRMMHQLARSGKLKGLAGLIVGDFSDCRDTERPFGNSFQGIIRERVADLGIPVCFGFPVGHGQENLALKCGVTHVLKVTPRGAVLSESPA